MLVAAVIPWVDIASVYRGPTKVIVEQQPGTFERIAIAFPVPESGGARLGPPDVIFFALFLAASTRFGLRPAATWIGMTAALSLTLVATYVLDLNGLPALPAPVGRVRAPERRPPVAATPRPTAPEREGS